MITPFKTGNKITQVYGNDIPYYSQFGLLRGHEGVDIVPQNSNDRNIYCIEDGVVVRDNIVDRFYGIYSVIWNKEKKRAWWYCHLDSEQLAIGQEIKRGQIVGIMGGTGNVDGDHLHLGLRRADENGNALNTDDGMLGFINPLPVVNALNGMYNEDMRTIALSAGHYLKDPGASAGNLIERDLAIDITNRAVDMLRKHGLGVLDVPDDIDLAPTIQWINDRAASNNIELCVEIHLNAGGGNGVEAWAYANLTTHTIDPNSQKLGQFMVDAINVESGLSKRGVKPEYQYSGGRLGFVHDTIPLATLIECGFVDGSNDKKILGTEAGRKNIAKGVARGILGYMGLQWKPQLIDPVVTPPAPPAPTPPPVDPTAPLQQKINELTSQLKNTEKERDDYRDKLNIANSKIEKAKANLA